MLYGGEGGTRVEAVVCQAKDKIFAFSASVSMELRGCLPLSKKISISFSLPPSSLTVASIINYLEPFVTGHGSTNDSLHVLKRQGSSFASFSFLRADLVNQICTAMSRSLFRFIYPVPVVCLRPSLPSLFLSFLPPLYPWYTSYMHTCP